MSFSRLVLLLAFALPLCGCGEGEGLAVRALDVSRQGWDSASVRLALEHRGRWGEGRPVEAERVEVRLYDADYRMLFEGDGLAFRIPDARLGDGEPLMLEVCGFRGGERACAQEGLHASPKRVRAAREQSVRWPQDDAYRIGSYDLDLRLERQRPDSAAWEALDLPPDLRTFLLARVDSAAGDASVRVPVEPARGRFDLKREKGFAEFRYALENTLFEGRDAHVRFEVMADLRGQSWTVDSVAKRIEAKSDTDRGAEATALAADAARRVLEHLSSFYGERDARMYLDEWTWDRLTKRYEIVLTLYWRGSFADRGRYRLTGVLRVAEDGAGARFEVADGNFRALRRWQSRVDSDVLPLPRLDASGE